MSGDGDVGPSVHPSPQKDRILMFAPEDALFQGLTQAMQRRLPEFQVILRADTGERGVDGVCLVLLHHKAGTPLDGPLRYCRQHYAGVPTGLVIDGGHADLVECEMAFGNRIVQGLLPLELKLDIWLAAVSLLISGGEYYPPFLTRHIAAPYREREARARVEAQTSTSVPEMPRSELTSRELEILELVAEGYQNKLIADRVGLSEHTVKVHVHNLIHKLKVTNRTQAAAAFRTRLDRAAPTPAEVWRATR